MEATLDPQAIDTRLAEVMQEIAKLKEEATKLQKQKPRMPVEQDYEFARPDGSKVRLAELFGDKPDLLVIHNMGQSCPYCTLWADGFESIQKHLKSRAGFALASADDAATLKEFSAARGWTYPVVAAANTSFFKDMGFEQNGEPWPGVSAFRKDADGKIYRVGRADFGPGDDFCPTWPLLDLLQDGPNGWEPYAEGY